MFRLHPPGLTPKTLDHLRASQSSLDALSTYQERVEQSVKKWKVKASTLDGKAAFAEIKLALSQMSSVAQRCHYCEDSFADEVEHIQPKTLYPELTFAWENYLYVCGPCNGPKSNRFAVINAQGVFVDVSRSSADPVAPPSAGAPALINPRVEDPLDFLTLDLIDTFYFIPLESLAPEPRRRADYTIELLRLNERPHLVEMRRREYKAQLNKLVLYAWRKNQNPHDPELPALLRSLGEVQFRAVWACMKSRRREVPDLLKCFGLAPEALEV